jgi:lipopolysaccharide export system permease protein
MLFHSSLRKELARSFGATLVVLVTVVMTMTLIRTVGEASRGTFNPTDVLLVMGYTVLSDLPTILSMSLFIAVLGVLTRMYKDSEMVIWFGSGMGLTALLRPVLRFAWPILVGVVLLSFVILPWAFGRIEDLRDRYEKRGDIARIEPGQFQESANGDRVFFIEKNSPGQQSGNNVFIATHEKDKQTVTSARAGHVETRDNDKFLILDNGQRLERTVGKDDLTVSDFEVYGARVGADDASARSYVPASSLTTLELLTDPSPKNLGELAWRIGLSAAAFNFIIIGIAAAGLNPRVGRTANLGFAFLTFVVYFNFLVLSKSWIESGQLHFAALLVLLHGGALAAGLLWLFKRHNQWHWGPRRRSPKPPAAGDGP